MFSKTFYLILSLTLITLVIQSNSKKIPDSIKLCDRKDLECIRNSTEVALHMWDEFPAELGLPKMKPIKIDRIEIKRNRKNTNFDINAVYTDIEIFGFEDAKVKEVTGNLEDGFTIKNFLPNYQLTAKCEIEGKILLFEFKGSGDFNVTLTNMRTDVSLYFEKYQCPDGQNECIKIKRARINSKPEKIEMKLASNSKDISSDFAKILENVVNDNAKELWNEYEPFFNKKSSGLLRGNVNKFITDIPIKDMFLN